MADYESGFGRLEDQLSGLEGAINGLESVTGAFRRELDGVQGTMKDAGREASTMSRSLSSSIRGVFEDILVDGKSVGKALGSAGLGLSSKILSQAMQPIQTAVGSAVSGGLSSLIGGLKPFADGGAFIGGRVAAFARGGIVDGPTHFPMRGGVGLMGEAGPEAILPLARGGDGKLGIRAGGSGSSSVRVTMNITSPDAAGFRQSQSQIAAEMSRAIQRGRRNL